MKLSEIKIERFESGVERSKFTVNEYGPDVEFGEVLDFSPTDGVPLWYVEFPDTDIEVEFECEKSEVMDRIEEYCVDIYEEDELPEAFTDD